MFSGFLPLILQGLLWTIAVSGASLIVGLLFGVILALGELSQKKIISVPTFMITGTLRGLPEIVVLFFCYFGGTIILTNIFGHYVGINAFLAGVIGLGIIFGAYSAQVFRGAFYQVPAGQFAAASAMGLSKTQTFAKIILPQILHHAKPGLSNLWISLIKDSSLVSLIGLAETMNNIGLASSRTHQPFLFYSLAAVLYLILTSVSKNLFERKTQWI
jgi:His/Glu/Gln/Arg/opine family amino acid ABC transporter permease subunit